MRGRLCRGRACDGTRSTTTGAASCVHASCGGDAPWHLRRCRVRCSAANSAEHTDGRSGGQVSCPGSSCEKRSLGDGGRQTHPASAPAVRVLTDAAHDALDPSLDRLTPDDARLEVPSRVRKLLPQRALLLAVRRLRAARAVHLGAGRPVRARRGRRARGGACGPRVDKVFVARSGRRVVVVAALEGGHGGDGGEGKREERSREPRRTGARCPWSVRAGEAPRSADASALAPFL